MRVLAAQPLQLEFGRAGTGSHIHARSLTVALKRGCFVLDGSKPAIAGSVNARWPGLAAAPTRRRKNANATGTQPRP